MMHHPNPYDTPRGNHDGTGRSPHIDATVCGGDDDQPDEPGKIGFATAFRLVNRDTPSEEPHSADENTAA